MKLNLKKSDTWTYKFSENSLKTYNEVTGSTEETNLRHDPNGQNELLEMYK